MRKIHKHIIDNLEQFKQKLLLWSQQYNEVIWLESNDHNQSFSDYDAILAVDALTSIQMSYNGAFEALKEYQSITKDWLFGYLTYDLKNDVEDLKSENPDGLHFSDLCFFQPKKIFLIKGNCLELHYLTMIDDEFEYDLNAIETTDISLKEDTSEKLRIKLRIHKDEYFDKVTTMLEHIHRGDIYEANFCQEFYVENAKINPYESYQKLNVISKPPFATYLKLDDKYLLSASPERYLKKEGDTIISQPIKGTARRSENSDEDKQLKLVLSKDQKERSENIMIVDLVRNDLSHTASTGSVEVVELCKVYSFPQVHQMMSTITSKIKDDIHPVDVIRSTFPMGSMTGAPKISAMHIIEKLEETKRGLYSGAVGYFTPDDDFDFNVVIRSILYNQTEQFVSFSVGGAITAKSDPMKEYEECLIKAKAMREVLEN